VNFTGVDKAQFGIYVSAKVVQKFAAEKGIGFLAGLAGQKVTIRGDLSRHTSATTGETLINLEIAKPEQLTVLPTRP
jgi:hypothetical protein